VLKGDRSRVKPLQLNAGDLQFFLGRFSLHQVTENTGSTDRMLLIMSFAETAGMVGSMERSKNLYGKATAAHAARRAPTDGLVD
jgi:ectoine hydroxylase-related dioxygenase (phytanoyl-CoA dioxygenase family)